MRITNVMIEPPRCSPTSTRRRRASPHTQRQLSTGKADRRPSDDPLGAHRALALRARARRRSAAPEERRRRRGLADVTDTALGAHRRRRPARPRAASSRAPTARIGPAGRETIADEIDQLIEPLKSEANATYGGRYVFGGTDDRRRRRTRRRRRRLRRRHRRHRARRSARASRCQVNVRGATSSATAGAGDGSCCSTPCATSPPTCARGNAADATPAEHRPAGARRATSTTSPPRARRRRAGEPPRGRRRAPGRARGDRDRAPVRDRGRRHGEDADRLLHAAGRLPGRAAVRREHHPALAPRLPR